MVIRQTSIQAYKYLDLSKRNKVIFEGFQEYGNCTSREMMNYLGFIEPNQVRPRISEMVGEGVLVELYKRECSISGKTVMVFGVNNEFKK
jgi:predicted HTH transcriptional regulator